MPLPQCSTFVAANNMQPTIMGWPNGALQQFESRVPYNPTQRMHLRAYPNRCECEIEPAPEADPAYHWKEDIVPAALTTLAGAGVGAWVDETKRTRGATVGGLLGLGSYVFLRWISA